MVCPVACTAVTLVWSGVVQSRTSQWDYSALHTRTSFTTCRPLTGCPACVVRWWWVAGQRVPADDRLLDGRSAGPSWDLDKQPFVFVDAFVSLCGDLPTASTWTAQPDRPMLFLTYLFSAQESRLIPLLCAFYFAQRSKSKWRKAILDWHSAPAARHRPAIHTESYRIISRRVMRASPVVWISSRIVTRPTCNTERSGHTMFTDDVNRQNFSTIGLLVVKWKLYSW